MQHDETVIQSVGIAETAYTTVEWNGESFGRGPIGEQLYLICLNSFRYDPLTHCFRQRRDQSSFAIGEPLNGIEAAHHRSGRKHAEIDSGIGLEIGHVEDIRDAPPPAQYYRRQPEAQRR